GACARTDGDRLDSARYHRHPAELESSRGSRSGVGGHMSIDPISSATPPQKDTPARVKDAASQFEALMLGQMLKSVREASAGGWAGKSEDQSNDSIMEMAEQQIAQVLSSSGGLGLAKLIASGLTKR